MPIQVAGLALLFPQESGSLAMFTAIRRASSLRSLPLNNGSFLLDDTPCVASLTLRSCSRSILNQAQEFGHGRDLIGPSGVRHCPFDWHLNLGSACDGHKLLK